ncbi:sugar transporter family protein [Striga asiatica]|uniref:Sugar transporter family protein n=1 Tax=Striga asiatica TaxID=4170 RepID=A0A5A7PFW4_STRAF|nr:sugar transporter family protein [Striga asiatica]
MVEGGITRADKTEFTECWRTSWQTPYIMRLALSAGIGGLLFGYDTGVISGALLYIKEDFESVDKKTWLQVNGTWRWMLGIAGLPALGKEDEARSILEKIYPAEEVEVEVQSLHDSVEQEKREGANETGFFSQIGSAWKNDVVRRALYAGITVQVAQQFVGINTVMYYSPTIMQFAGFASNKTAMALSLVTSGLNALGTVVSMCFVDRYGRRRLMIISMIGIISCLVVLSAVFYRSSVTAPGISPTETVSFGGNSTCQAYTNAPDASSWGCMRCLQETNCGYCSASGNIYQPGACLALDNVVRGTCRAEKRTWYTEGCPSRIGFLAVVFLGLYIIMYAPGMGTAPWIVNSEIYPLKYRGLGGGIAAVSNWSSNLIVSETFLTLTEHLGSSGTFLLFAGFSFVGLVAIFFLVPETKGLQFSEVEKMLEKGYSPFKKSEKESKNDLFQFDGNQCQKPHEQTSSNTIQINMEAS